MIMPLCRLQEFDSYVKNWRTNIAYMGSLWVKFTKINIIIADSVCTLYNICN